MNRPVDWQPLSGSDPVPGDPDALQAMARRYGDQADELSAQVSRLQQIANGDGWDSDAGRAFAAQLHGFCTDLGRDRTRFDAIAAALAGYAPHLAQAQHDADTAVRQAQSSQNVIQSTPSTAPVAAHRRYELDAAHLSIADAARRLHQAVLARDAAAQQAARTIQAQVLTTAQTGGGTVVTPESDDRPGPGGVPAWFPALLRELGFLPPEGQGQMNDLLWAAALTGTGVGMATDWMAKAVYGRFQARVGNKFGRGAANLSPWERFTYSFDDRSWHAGPHQALQRGRWTTTGEWVGRAGVGLSFASAALGQWSADTHEHGINTGAQIARAATVGTATAAGAWAGAEGGATLGGAIGTAIAPGAGTVVGAAVGGIVGGFAGSAAGGWLGDQIKDEAGDAVDWSQNAAGNAKDWSQDAVAKVGDVFGF